MRESLGAKVRAHYEEKEQQVGPEIMAFFQRMIMLQIVDAQWKDHLYALDHLKEGIGLRGYGQRDPLVEYKKESFFMFQALMDRIDEEVLKWIHLYEPVPVSQERAERETAPAPAARASREPAPAFAPPRAQPLRNLTFNDPSEAPSAFAKAEPEAARGGGEVVTVRREGPKVGRNDPCPCGSGKKYKKCHGAN